MSCTCGYINCASCSRRSSLQEYASSLEHTLRLRNDELAKCRADFAVAIRELHDVVDSREHHIVRIEKERDVASETYGLLLASFNELHAKAALLEAMAEHGKALENPRNVAELREARATVELLHAENAALQATITALREERARRQ